MTCLQINFKWLKEEEEKRRKEERKNTPQKASKVLFKEKKKPIWQTILSWKNLVEKIQWTVAGFFLNWFLDALHALFSVYIILTY